MRIIKTDNIPPPQGHYSACIEHNGLLYISGQLPFRPGSKELPDGIIAQTKQVLANVEFLVKEGGSTKINIIQMRLYIPNVEMWSEVNKVYSEFFGEHKPVRCVVPTRDLHYGALIEVEAIAFI